MFGIMTRLAEGDEPFDWPFTNISFLRISSDMRKIEVVMRVSRITIDRYSGTW